MSYNTIQYNTNTNTNAIQYNMILGKYNTTQYKYATMRNTKYITPYRYITIYNII